MESCKVEWCETAKGKAGGFCGKHYEQNRIHGFVKRINRLSPNEIIDCEDHTEVVLRDTHGNECARALIDTEDRERVSKIKWHLIARKEAEKKFFGDHAYNMEHICEGAIRNVIINN